MTFRFEEEDYQNTYVLEDFYGTNPFEDSHCTLLCLHDPESEVRLSFIYNFNKTYVTPPGQGQLTQTQASIVKGFVKDMPEELATLIKQRYFEAKAYGEKNPRSYLEFQTGRYANYIEMFPHKSAPMNFSFDGQNHFAEDSYEMDPRIKNQSVKLSFYEEDTQNEKQSALFHYTYFFDEEKRAEVDSRLQEEESAILYAFHQFVPGAHDVLKTRYKEVKKLGAELMEEGPQIPVQVEEEKPKSKKKKGKKEKRVVN